MSAAQRLSVGYLAAALVFAAAILAADMSEAAKSALTTAATILRFVGT